MHRTTRRLSLQRFREIENLGRAALIALVLALVSQATILTIGGDSRDAVIRMQTALSYDAYLTELKSWRPVDFERYWAHVPPDTTHPLFYGTAIMLGLAWALQKSKMSQQWNVLMWLPWIAGFLDEIENIAHIFGLMAFPDPPLWTFWVGNPAAIIKWLLSVGATIMIPVIIVLGKRRSESSE